LAAMTTNTVPLQGLRFDNLLSAVSASDDMEAGAGVYLVVKNANAGACTVTLVTPETVDGDLAVADRVVTVVATTGYSIIPITSRYRDPTTGRATVTFSPTATVTSCVIKTAVQ
jgi:hypothetical protein